MESCLAYEQCLFDCNEFQNKLFRRSRKPVDSMHVKNGKLEIYVYGFETNKEVDVFERTVDVLSGISSELTPFFDHDVDEIAENKSECFSHVISQLEINTIRHRRMLEESFLESLSEKTCDKECFTSVFEQLGNRIQKLDFKGCFVDVSQVRNRINFNLVFDGGLFISIAKTIDSIDSDEVMFSISRNKKKIIISQMNVDDLMEKISEVQKIAVG